MTGHSNFIWFNTAWFIIQGLNEANAAGYICQLMPWADSDNHSMIRLSSSGAHTLTPYLLHDEAFSKEIDKGYIKVKVLSPSVPSLSALTSILF